MLKDILKIKYLEYHDEINNVAHKLSDSIEDALKSQFMCSDESAILETTINMHNVIESSEKLCKMDEIKVIRDLYDRLQSISPTFDVIIPENRYEIKISRPTLIQFFLINNMLLGYHKLEVKPEGKLHKTEFVWFVIRTIENIIMAATCGANEIYIPDNNDKNDIKFICDVSGLKYKKSDSKNAYIISGWTDAYPIKNLNESK